MSIDFHIVRHETYLECIVTGLFELEEAKRAFVRLLEECAKYHPPGLLIDARQVGISKPISFRDRFDFAQYAARKGIHARARGLGAIRTAFLGSAALIDTRRFGETVAANLGVKVHPTADEADALAWLGVETAEKHDHENPTPAGG